MRYCLILTLLLTLTFTISAQDDVLMPDDLPDPIFFVEPNEVYWMNPAQFAWLDTQTLVFEYFGTGYQYELDATARTDLSSSPFRADMSDEAREWFRVYSDAVVYQSPYTMSDGRHNILYFSEIGILCNPECSSAIIFRGTYESDDTGNFSGTFAHTDFHTEAFINNIFWSSDNSGAVMERGSAYGGGTGLYYWDLETHDEIQIPVYLADSLTDRTLAISPDGNRVAVSSMSIDFDTTNNSGQKLVIWTAPYHDDICACTYDPQMDIIEPSILSENYGNGFAGVGFVDDDTILYIGEMGLVRHNLLTGVSTIIDPELNVGWIRTAVFSPDNQHVAITTEQGLYILQLSL